MKTEKEIELKKLEITLEKIKTKKQENMHNFRMKELKVRKEIAELFDSKNQKKRISKKINKLKKENKK
jgi:hypothetical protein